MCWAVMQQKPGNAWEVSYMTFHSPFLESSNAKLKTGLRHTLMNYSQLSKRSEMNLPHTRGYLMRELTCLLKLSEAKCSRPPGSVLMTVGSIFAFECSNQWTWETSEVSMRAPKRLKVPPKRKLPHWGQPQVRSSSTRLIKWNAGLNITLNSKPRKTQWLGSPRMPLNACPPWQSLIPHALQIRRVKQLTHSQLAKHQVKMAYSLNSSSPSKAHSSATSANVFAWREGIVPQVMKVANTVTLYKNKGDRNNCNSYQGISLLHIIDKVIGHVVIKRLKDVTDRVYPSHSVDLKPTYLTVNMVFTLRQLQEKCRKQGKLFHAFIDLKKAFNLMSRQPV